MNLKSEKLNRFIGLLTNIFELDKTDLDFGIYRIMNIRKDEISQFLSEGLPKRVQETLVEFVADTAAIQSRIAEIEKQAAGFGGIERVDASTPLAMEFARLKSQLAGGRDSDAIETDVYSALYNFFGRYYDDGDFISKRRYKEGVYAIPYEGEEVKLYWANSDQYYIKTAENFRDYTFVDDGKKVHFRTVDATTERNNNKENGTKRVFMLYEENAEKPCVKAIDEVNGELVIRFVYDLPNSNSSNILSTEKKYAKETFATIAVISDAIQKDFRDWRRLLAPASSLKGEKRSMIEKHLNAYVAKNTFDYFIHKDLRGFLTRELDFFIKSEVIHLEDIDTTDEKHAESYLAKVRVVKRVGKIIIDFLAQLEEFQKKLWLKKKFVVDSNWCITLDRVDESFYPEIIANAGQIAEWVKMYAINDIEENLSDVGFSESLTGDFLRQNGNLVLDTWHFTAGFKDRLLASIDNLDMQTEGLMIHSENFQALGLLHNKYKAQVDGIYIDPPYNADATRIVYKNGYLNSSWCALMHDRLILSRKLLDYNGVLCATIDDYELYNLKPILDNVFDDNYLATTVIRNNPSGRSTVSGFSVNHEYGLYYKNNAENIQIGRLSHTEKQIARYDEIDGNGKRYEWENLRKSSAGSFHTDRPKQCYPIYVNSSNLSIRIPSLEWNDTTKEYATQDGLAENEVASYPIDPQGQMRVWRWGLERIRKFSGEVKAIEKNGQYELYTPKYLKEDGILPRTWWDKPDYSARDRGTRMIANFFGGGKPFEFAKAVVAVEDTISIMCTDDDSTILDYFAGSGTTGHAVLNLNRADDGNRKYILVEMGEYFNTVTLPRMKKVIYSADWKDGKPQNRNTGVSHIMKYITLESYEDALSNIELSDDMAQIQIHLPDGEARLAYMLNHMLGMESRDSLLNLDAFALPFSYNLKISENNETKEKTVDLPETFNYLLGLSVVRQSAISYFSATPLTETEWKKEDLYEGSVRLAWDTDGEFGFKQIEGKLPDGKRTLIIWRTMTDDLLRSNAALDAYFIKNRINPSDRDFDLIYVNGDNNLENLRLDEENWKVQRIEPVFKRKMFEGTE